MLETASTTLFGTLALGLLGLGVAAPATPPAPAQTETAAELREADEEVLKSGDLTKLSRSIADYFAAKAEDSGTYKVLDEIDELAEKLEKKAKRPLAALVGDVQRALLLAEDLKDSATGKGKPAAEELEGHWGDTIPYVLHGPKEYRVKNGAVPLVLVLPEEGADLEELFREHYATSTLVESAVVAIVGMPEDAGAWNSFGSEGTPGGIANVLQILSVVRAEYLVDPDRLFIMGHGAGVGAAFDIASIYPTLFAGVAGRTGDLGETKATNFFNLPSLIIGGADNATAFAEQAKAAGSENVELVAEGTMEVLVEWMADKRRNAEPLELRFSPTTDFSREAYWLRVEGFESILEPQLVAVVDREANSITITGSGFTNVSVQFNDRLVDLGRPVTVTINGEEHQGEYARSLKGMLDSVYRSGDNGRLYSAAASFEFPPPIESAE